MTMAEALAGQAATRQLAQEAARQARQNAQGLGPSLGLQATDGLVSITDNS
jgi:hypothetical protein